MDSKGVKFDWIEYSIFTLMLTMSALIGVYFGFIKKAGQNTIDGYLLGGKKMTIFPISMSLISSFISGVALLGVPAEIYTYGISYIFAFVSYTVVGFIIAYVFLPVFFKLQLISVYEYMELRFNRFVRKIVSLLFTLSLIIYTPIVIYGPALALSQVSEYDLYTCATFLSAICIFYTSFGGLKAVVWTDTLQGLVMYGAIFTVAAIGTAKSNGVSSVFNSAYEGGRLDINWDLDPRNRGTAWSFTIGWIINTTLSAVHPSFTQRLISLSTIKEARWSVCYYMIGCSIFCLFNAYMGLMVYSHYKDCDPLSTGAIHKSDEILSYFIMNVVRNVRGLPGVFIAGIVSAGLSTMSAGLNTLAGTIYEDFIEPVTGKVSDARAANIMKVLVVVFGVLCLLLVMVMEKLGSLVELYTSLGGPAFGTVLGIFILGLLFPHVGSTGATAGGLVSLATMCWIIYGFRSALNDGDIVYPTLPVSVEGCTYNFTMPSNSTLTRTAVSGRVFPLFEISIFYYTTIACLVAVVVGIVVTYITGTNKLETVDRDLISPLIHRYLPDYTSVPVKETELKAI